uniref:Uncharacterized protein n=1 Tax=Lepeophtheirus salmonis TaxID=72036 RepID=A0A0K2UFH6_LEPSM
MAHDVRYNLQIPKDGSKSVEDNLNTIRKKFKDKLSNIVHGVQLESRDQHKNESFDELSKSCVNYLIVTRIVAGLPNENKRRHIFEMKMTSLEEITQVDIVIQRDTIGKNVESTCIAERYNIPLPN